MADNYQVPITLPDGRTFNVPVEGAESPEQAAEYVQKQIDSGALEFPAPDTQAPEAPPSEWGASNERLRGGSSPEEEKMFEELRTGVGRTGYNAGITLLKLGRSTAPAWVPDHLQGAYINGSYRAEEQLRRDKKAAEYETAKLFAQTWGEEPSEFMIGVGQELPYLPLAFIPGLQGSTFTRMTASNMLQGALASGLATADGDQIQGASLGAGIAFGVSAFMGGLPGVRSFIGRKWAQQSETAEAKARLALEQKIRQESGNEDFGFGLGEIGQENPFLVSLTRSAKARSQTALDRGKRNLQTIVDTIERRAGSIQDRGKLATELSSLMVESSNRMHGLARRNYQAGMDHLIGKYGDDILIDGRKYLDDMEVLLQDRLGLGDGEVPPQLLRHIEKVDLEVNPATTRMVKDKAGNTKYRVTDRKTGEVLGDFDNYEVADRLTVSYNETNGGLTTRQSVDILKSHNRLISGEQNVFDVAAPGSNDALGKYLKQSMLGSMRGQSSDAITLMNRINEAYAYDMQMVRELRNSHLGKIFGGDPTQMTPQQALEQLLGEGTDRASLQATRKVLQQEAPGLLYDLQRQQVREVLTQGRSGAFSSADLEADINLLMTALSGKGDKSNVGKIGMGLFSPGEQQHMIDAAKALSVIRTTYMKTGQSDASAASLAEDVGINIVSRSPEFVARLMTRIFMRGDTVAHLMTDHKAREMLIQLGKNGPDSPAFKAIAMSLATWTGQVMAEQDARAQEEQNRQAGVEDPGGA